MIKNLGKKTPFIIVGAFLVVLIAGALIYTASISAGVEKWNNLIYPGVTIGNIDVAGKTKEEAMEMLKNHYEKKAAESNIKVQAKDKEFVLNLATIDIEYNLEKSIEEAFNYGKSLTLFSKHSLIKNSKTKNFEVIFTYNQEKVTEFSSQVAGEVDKAPVDATIKISGGSIKVIGETPGYKVDTEDLNQKLKSAIEEDLEEDKSIEASIVDVAAKITAEQLSAIDGKLSSYTTNYSSSSASRAHNIALAASSINGTILMPGEVFSYNGVVGRRTAERGYQEAGVFIGNKVEQGIGGGICQVSSTLYMSAMSANLRSVERRNHTMPVGYVPLGCDATVDYGNIDYQFKNTYDFPIYIETIAVNRNLTINIYGRQSGMGGRSYKLVGETVKTNEPSIKTVEDPTMALGTEAWEVKPVTGYVVKTYLITYENGKQISKEPISTDTYVTVNGVLKKGTKPVETKPVEPTKPAEPTAPSEPIEPTPPAPTAPTE